MTLDDIFIRLSFYLGSISKFIINKASPATHLSSFSPQSFFKLVDKVFSNILEFGSINGGMELYAVCTK